MSQPTHKLSSFAAWTNNFLVKSIAAGIVIFAGVAGGIYTGMALTRQGSTPEEMPNNTLLDIGETFPDYALWNPHTNETTSVSALTSRGPTLLIFVSANCGPCHSMAAYWRKKVTSQLREDIQIALVYNNDELVSDDRQVKLLDIPGALTLGADRATQREDDGITSTPTFVALDEQMKISLILTGFRRDLGSDYFNENL